MRLRKRVRSWLRGIAKRRAPDASLAKKTTETNCKESDLTPSGLVRVVKGKPFMSSQGGHTLAVERIDASSTRIVQVVGWYDSLGPPSLQLVTKAGPVEPHGIYRVRRAAVVESGRSSHPHAGFVAEFYVTDAEHLLCGATRIEVPRAELVGKVTPDYNVLFETDQVLHREHIYSYGHPVDAPDDVVELCMTFPGSILDFGCGNGDLVRRLRGLGREAHGIELASDRVEGKTKPEAQPFVQMYDGQFPMPYEDGSFDFVVATEVIEHIPHPERLPAELARIARQGLFVSVPDMTSIPSGFEHRVVPWHLLEATHLNFFTTKSLAKLFAGFFIPERAYRIGTRVINGRMIPGSVAMRFRRIRP